MKKRILCGVMALCLASVFLCSCKPKKTDPEAVSYTHLMLPTIA